MTRKTVRSRISRFHRAMLCRSWKLPFQAKRRRHRGIGKNGGVRHVSQPE